MPGHDEWILTASRLHEYEVAGVQARELHVLERNHVPGIKRDHHIGADLLAGGQNGLKVAKHAILERDVIAAAEVRHHIVPELGAECERIAAVPAGERVVARTAAEPVITIASRQEVVAGSGGEVIIAVAAREC